MKRENRTIGKLVNFYRHQNQYKQEQLAEKIGVTQSILSDIENDKHIVSVPLLIKLSEIFNIPPSALLPEDKSNTFNNNFTDNAINHGANIHHQNGNFEEERKLYKELIASKDEIIRVKDDLIAQLKSKRI